MNFLDAAALSREPGGLCVASADFGELIVPALEADRVKAGAKLTIGVRPEHLTLSQQGGPTVSGVVQLVEKLGDQTLLEVSTAHSASLMAKADPTSRVVVGDTVRLGCAPQALHAFDADGVALGRP